MRERIRSAIKIFRMNSVVMRNMALILTVVFVLMGTIGALFYFNARESREHERDMILRTNAATIRDNFDTVLKDGELIALQTAMNQNVLNFCLFSPSESVLTGIRDSIANYTTVFPYIHSIYIYSNNKDLLIENQPLCGVPTNPCALTPHAASFLLGRSRSDRCSRVLFTRLLCAGLPLSPARCDRMARATCLVLRIYALYFECVRPHQICSDFTAVAPIRQ